MSNHIKDRRETYYKLNSRLSELYNKQLVSLFRKTKETPGWSIKHTIKLGGSKVFVKRLPVTDVEYNNMFSTKNLYGLPTYYNIQPYKIKTPTKRDKIYTITVQEGKCLDQRLS